MDTLGDQLTDVTIRPPHHRRSNRVDRGRREITPSLEAIISINQARLEGLSVERTWYCLCQRLRNPPARRTCCSRPELARLLSKGRDIVDSVDAQTKRDRARERAYPSLQQTLQTADYRSFGGSRASCAHRARLYKTQSIKRYSQKDRRKPRGSIIPID